MLGTVQANRVQAVVITELWSMAGQGQSHKGITFGNPLSVLYLLSSGVLMHKDKTI